MKKYKIIKNISDKDIDLFYKEFLEGYNYKYINYENPKYCLTLRAGEEINTRYVKGGEINITFFKWRYFDFSLEFNEVLKITEEKIYTKYNRFEIMDI